MTGFGDDDVFNVVVVVVVVVNDVVDFGSSRDNVNELLRDLLLGNDGDVDTEVVNDGKRGTFDDDDDELLLLLLLLVLAIADVFNAFKG